MWAGVVNHPAKLHDKGKAKEGGVLYMAMVQKEDVMKKWIKC